MKTVVTVYADKPDFNQSNALIIYSITYLASHRGFNTIVIGGDNIPGVLEKINVVSYINSMPNVIVEKWVRATDIAIVLSEILHENFPRVILCYGISCVLAAIPIKKYATLKVAYVPSVNDFLVLEGGDKLLSETYSSLIRYSLDYVDLVFDSETRIQHFVNEKGEKKSLFTSDFRVLEKFVFSG